MKIYTKEILYEVDDDFLLENRQYFSYSHEITPFEDKIRKKWCINDRIRADILVYGGGFNSQEILQNVRSNGWNQRKIEIANRRTKVGIATSFEVIRYYFLKYSDLDFYPIWSEAWEK